MNIKTFIEALVKFLMGILMVGLLVFLPAGTINYWQGLLLMGILFIPILIFGVVLMIKNPSLLRKRLSSKEKEKEQKNSSQDKKCNHSNLDILITLRRLRSVCHIALPFFIFVIKKFIAKQREIPKRAPALSIRTSLTLPALPSTKS